MDKNLFSNATTDLNDLWMYALGIFAIFVGYFVGQLPLFWVTKLAIDSDPNFGIEKYNEFNNSMDFSMIGIHSNTGFLLLIFMFVFAMAALFLVLHFQQKNFIELITPKRKVNFRKIIFGFALWFFLGTFFEIGMYFNNPEDYTFSFKPLSFFILLLISLIALPIQTSFEELFFRGYIMQGVTNFYPYKWFGLLVSTIFFAFVHGANPEITEYGIAPMMTYYILAGLFLGLITIFDNSLELALGVHWATNFFGATFLSYKGSVLQTDTLFKSEAINPWIMTLFFLLTSISFAIICWYKYGWKMDDFHSIFRIIKEEEIEDNRLLSTKTNTSDVAGTNSVSDTNYSKFFNESDDEGAHNEIS